jgi:hypothetical protein
MKPRGLEHTNACAEVDFTREAKLGTWKSCFKVWARRERARTVEVQAGATKIPSLTRRLTATRSLSLTRRFDKKQKPVQVTPNFCSFSGSFRVLLTPRTTASKMVSSCRREFEV